MKTFCNTKLASALGAMLIGTLVACGDPNQSAGQKVDAAVASGERAAAEVKMEVRQVASDTKAAASAAAATARQHVRDAEITALVNGKLAKDGALNLLRINVDTRDGHVMLTGAAPDAQAVGRATQLAAAVEGVTSVDNHLTAR